MTTDLTSIRIEALIDRMDASNTMAVAGQIAAHPDESEVRRLNLMWAEKVASGMALNGIQRSDDYGSRT
jgi:hypothetical protein